MSNYGTLQRTTPRLRVIKGYVGQNSNQRQEVAPVKSGMAIMSGMVISKLWSTNLDAYEWVLGLVAGATPYIALQDYTDADVVAAGGLTGLSCAGQYTLESAYFGGTTTSIYDGTPLTAYANDDGTPANRGKLKIAETGNIIIATAIRKSGESDASPMDDAEAYSSNVVADGDGEVKVLRFDTSFIANNKKVA